MRSFSGSGDLSLRGHGDGNILGIARLPKDLEGAIDIKGIEAFEKDKQGLAFGRVYSRHSLYRLCESMRCGGTYLGAGKSLLPRDEVHDEVQR